MINNKTLVKLIWGMSTNFDSYNYHLECLTNDIAKEYGLTQEEKMELFESIVQGLKEMTDEIYTKDDLTFGYIEELGVFWWDNNAETCWVVDEPDWWEDVIKDAKCLKKIIKLY